MNKYLLLLTGAVCFFTSSSYGQNVGVDVASPVEKLDVLGAIHIGNTSNNNTGTIRWNSPNFQGYDGTQWINFGGGTLTGSGTTNIIPKWTSSSALGNSILYDNGFNLGIGTTSPNNNAELVGTNSTVNFGILKTGNNWVELFAGTTVGGTGTGINFDNTAFFRINSSATRQNSSPTELLRVTSTGNVGVGSIAPGAKLDVAGTTKTTNFQMTATPTANYVLRSDASGNGSWVDPNTLVTGLLPAGTTGQTLRHNGTTWTANSVLYNDGTNVGIGTTAPNYKLDVSGTDFLSLKLIAPTSPLLKLSGSYNSGNGAEFWQDATGDARLNISGTLNAIYMKSTGDIGIGIAFPTTPSARLDVNNGASTVPIFLARDNGTEVMRIADGGNVGIGSAAPAAKLDVAGQVKITGGTPALNQVLTSDASGLATWEPAQGDNLGNHIATQNIELNSNWLSNDGGSEGVRIDNNGNVGIGQTPGSAYLDITGTNAGTTSLQLRSGNAGNTFTSNQVVMGYNNTENYRHAIKTRHQSGGTANAIDFFIWDQPNDPAATVGTLNVMSVTGLNNGSVGIGVNSPGAQLHTTGSVRFAGLTSATQTSAVMTDGSGNLSTRALNAVAFTGDLASGDADYIQNQSVGNNFATGQAASFDVTGNAEIGGTLEVNGNVGIGTTTPGGPLQINTSTAGRYSWYHNFGSFSVFNPETFVGELRLGEASGRPGLYSSGRLELQASATGIIFGSGNAEHMRLTSSGSLGIGTNNPTGILQINTPTAGRLAWYHSFGSFSVFNPETFVGELRLGEASGRPGLYSSGRLELQSSATGILFGSGNAEHMRLTSAGRLGIGTNNPSNLLTVEGPGEQALLHNPTNDGSIGINFNENSANAARIHHEGDYASGYLEFEDYTAGWTGTGLVVKQNNVGIATINPQNKLNVVNTSLAGGTASIIAINSAYTLDQPPADIRAAIAGIGHFTTTAGVRSAGIYAWVPTGGHGTLAAAAIFDRPDNNRRIFIGGSQTTINTPSIHVYNTSTTATDFIVDNSGNVGVGTVSPATKLDVNGTATATALAGAFDQSASGYVRIGNMQIAWGTTTLASGQGWTAGGSGSRYVLCGQNITFPAAFVSAPTVTFGMVDGQIAARSAYVSYFIPSTSDVNNIYLSSPIPHSETSGVVVHWTAIGRWQ